MRDLRELYKNKVVSNNDLLDNYQDYFIFHIPHSSREIPILDGFNQDLIENELNLLTDSATDRIFDVKYVDRVVFPYSRIFCDVERLDDDNEPMFQYGRGFYYTKTDNGEDLRVLDEELKTKIKTEYYDVHHDNLSFLIEKKLKDTGYVYVIDCHSFNDVPLNSDLDKNENRPDICIGTDSFHTPKWLINYFVNFFERNGLSVKINSPYSGTIIPSKFVGSEKVMGIMIELNKKLYMDGNNVMEDKIKFLNKLIDDLLVP
jgi:N-formylglutamate deformylase